MTLYRSDWQTDCNFPFDKRWKCVRLAVKVKNAMHFQTFSIVVGTRACNASCPFCISKQTGLFGTPIKVNWRNFHIACNLAQKANTTTVLLTGKGEPTLPVLVALTIGVISTLTPRRSGGGRGLVRFVVK